MKNPWIKKQEAEHFVKEVNNIIGIVSSVVSNQVENKPFDSYLNKLLNASQKTYLLLIKINPDYEKGYSSEVIKDINSSDDVSMATENASKFLKKVTQCKSEESLELRNQSLLDAANQLNVIANYINQYLKDKK